MAEQGKAARITQRAETVWTYEYTAQIIPGVHFPVRSTLVALKPHVLVVISPGPFERTLIQDFAAAYAELYCVAPNAFHHMHLRHFHGLFPEASIHGPAALERKQPWLKGRLQSVQSLAELLQGQLDCFPIQGNPSLAETLYYCRRSRTLIVTDLLFNMQEPMPRARRWLLRCVGAHNQVAQSRLIRLSTQDKKAYLQSLQALVALDCQRLIVRHGTVLETAAEIQAAWRALGLPESGE